MTGICDDGVTAGDSLQLGNCQLHILDPELLNFL